MWQELSLAHLARQQTFHWRSFMVPSPEYQMYGQSVTILDNSFEGDEGDSVERNCGYVDGFNV